MEIVFFYGANCPHCHVMLEMIPKIESECKIKIKKLEVWNDDENADYMRKFIDIIKADLDGQFGVPAFVNVTKNTAFCGEKSYGELKQWILKN